MLCSKAYDFDWMMPRGIAHRNNEKYKPEVENRKKYLRYCSNIHIKKSIIYDKNKMR